MTTCDETRSEKLAVCAQYADQGYETCSQQADQGYQTCSEHKDQGYNRCSEQKDLGYSQCQSWSPWFSWICLFAVWISNVVCVAWTWVSNLACVLWTEVSYAGCKVLEWGMGSAVMRISPDEGDPLSDLPSFPDGFLWGAATSAYQVEGGITNNDWDFFTTDPTIVARVRSATGAVTPTPIELAPAGVADHHGNLDVLRQDLDRAVALGLNAYRFSLEWGRIQPTRPDPDHLEDAAFDEAAARFYSDAIDAMRERGLEPILTLNHMSLPIWASRPPLGSPFADENDPAWVASFRGWENPQTVDAYIRFVEFVVPRFKDRVKWWIPLNEPVGSMVVVGYIAGAWPPGFTMIDSSHALGAYFNLLRAHVRAYDRIKALAGADAKVRVSRQDTIDGNAIRLQQLFTMAKGPEGWTIREIGQ